jgi:hypothetical protein
VGKIVGLKTLKNASHLPKEIQRAGVCRPQGMDAGKKFVPATFNANA